MIIKKYLKNQSFGQIAKDLEVPRLTLSSICYRQTKQNQKPRPKSKFLLRDKQKIKKSVESILSHGQKITSSRLIDKNMSHLLKPLMKGMLLLSKTDI